MLRVVLDTNVFISHLLVRVGIPAQLFDAWRAHRYILVTSPAIISEIRATASYPRIRRKFHLTDDDVDGLVTLLYSDSIVVEGLASTEGTIPADPDDEAVLACALHGCADIVVSGDHHLLELREHKGIRILTPTQFLSQLNAMTS